MHRPYHPQPEVERRRTAPVSGTHRMSPPQPHYRPYIHHAHPQIDIDQQLQQKQMMAQQQQQRSIQRRRTPEDPPPSSSRIKSAEVPKIELSSRQQQLQQQLQRLTPPKKSNHPSHSAITRTYQEPWEKPFVLQQEAPPRVAHPSTMRVQNETREKSDPPTTNVHRPHPTTTTASSSSSAVQMDSQRAFLRSFLQKKQPSTRLPALVAHQTNSSERSAASSTSPSALLQRVLHQARSPKEKSNTVPPTSTSSTLQEKMRQRFQNQKGASTGSSSHPTVRTDAKSRPVERADQPKRTTTPKSLPSGKEDGYDGFVESLMKEVSAHHSQLYASFLAAIDPHVMRDQVLQECLASPRQKNKVDKDTIQRLHSYVQKQQNGAEACRPVSQLVNDKQYKALSPRHMKKKANPVKFKLPLEELSPPPPSKRMPSDTKPAPPSALEKLRSILKPTQKSPALSLQTPKSRTPNANSINDDDDPVLNTRSMDSSSTTETAPIVVLKKPQLSVQIPSIRSTDSSDGASSVASSRSHTVSSASMKHSPAWKGLQLRSVASVSSAPSPLPESSVHAFSAATGNSSQQPEWATITLRPVSVAERSVVTIPPTAVSSHNEAPPEQMTMEEIRNAESSIVLGLKSLQPNHRISKVVIGPTQIRQIEYENASSSLVHVIWTIRRDDMEPDGMTLNMPTLKVTLILRPGHLFKYKILCFESPEECLRFATAFYHRSAGDMEEAVVTQPIEMASSPPVEEIPDLASLSSDVNSSVRMTESILSEEEQVVLERYRELRQTKPATDAMHETLSKESEVSTLAEASTLILPKVVATSDLPSSPVSTFTTTTVGDVKMDAEPPLIEKFKLMLQRGVPPDAVRHKMTMEQVDDKIMAQVLGDPETTTTNTAASVETKPSTTVGSNLSAEDDAVAEKYRKMLKMGIPADGVRHKMTLEQVDAAIVAAVLGLEAIGGAPGKKEAPPAVATRDRDIRQVLSEEEESVASQYRKLLKINVSKDALLSRMKQEGVSPKIITAILGSGVLSSLEDGTKAVSNGSNGSKLIPINWDLTENAMAGSVWEVWQNAPDPEPMDFTQLKQIFQRKERNAMKQDMKHESSQGTGKAKLLDITRSNNIAISLKAFKEFSHAELAESIRFLDPMRKIRGERANFIRDLLPTVVEMKIVDEYAGPDDRLVPAELWFRHLRGIPRLQRKARVLRTMEIFTSDATEVRDNFRLLLQVCRQVMASVKLQDVLGMVLRIGNVMNEGTRNGRAAGFKFNSLLRLTQTKTADGKITVLDYLVSLFVEKGESDKLDLLSDFPDCHKASRFLISDMNNEVKLLKESLHQCKLELSDLERDQCPPPKETEAGGGTDARAQLFASIQARGGGASKEDVPVKKANEAFTKRDEFLAAIQNSKKDSTSNDIPVSDSDSVESKKRGTTSKPIENTLAGGILRLRNFVEVVDESFQRLEKQRDETLEACKDLSRYCGESGGVGVTISLLDVLSQFAKNLEDAYKKYHDQQQNEARKLKVQEAKDTRTASTSSGTTDSAGVKTEGTSIVVLVNDMLKNANPRFKEDFKKGRMVPNPSHTLKVIYQHEQQSKPSASNAPLRLDIVSAIQQRGSDNDDADELAKARSTFAGVVPDEDSSPRELAIDQTSSFPPTNMHSPMSERSPDETDTADNASNASLNESPPTMLSVKERAMLFHHPSEKTKNIEPSVQERPNPLQVASSPSKENIGDNGTPRNEGRRWGMEDGTEEPMIDLTRSRERLSQSRRSASPLLDVVKQSLEQRTFTNASVGTASPPPRVPERRKSLTERAREKRWDKHRVGSMDAAGLSEESPTTTTPLDSATESAMARLARQKRLQKRLSR